MGGIFTCAQGLRYPRIGEVRADLAQQGGEVRRERSQGGVGGGDGVVGVATSLGNPKAGVFAVSLLPQFVTAQGPVLASCIALGAVWASVSGSWFCCFGWTIDRGRARVTRPAFRRVMQAVTGVTLLCLGVAVAAGA